MGFPKQVLVGAAAVASISLQGCGSSKTQIPAEDVSNFVEPVEDSTAEKPEEQKPDDDAQHEENQEVGTKVAATEPIDTNDQAVVPVEDSTGKKPEEQKPDNDAQHEENQEVGTKVAATEGWKSKLQKLGDVLAENKKIVIGTTAKTQIPAEDASNFAEDAQHEENQEVGTKVAATEGWKSKLQKFGDVLAENKKIVIGTTAVLGTGAAAFALARSKWGAKTCTPVGPGLTETLLGSTFKHGEVIPLACVAGYQLTVTDVVKAECDANGQMHISACAKPSQVVIQKVGNFVKSPAGIFTIFGCIGLGLFVILPKFLTTTPVQPAELVTVLKRVRDASDEAQQAITNLNEFKVTQAQVDSWESSVNACWYWVAQEGDDPHDCSRDEHISFLSVGFPAQLSGKSQEEVERMCELFKGVPHMENFHNSFTYGEDKKLIQSEDTSKITNEVAGTIVSHYMTFRDRTDAVVERLNTLLSSIGDVLDKAVELQKEKQKEALSAILAYMNLDFKAVILEGTKLAKMKDRFDALKTAVEKEIADLSTDSEDTSEAGSSEKDSEDKNEAGSSERKEE